MLLWLSWAVPAAAQPPRQFAAPDRIRYDSQCLTIDGKDVFVYSGAFHYFRCPKELWPERFLKIKEAGFNTVETYAPWNWSEKQMPAGLEDFSKMDVADLDDWLKTAEEFGFYIIVRPGPYICAEWDTGGFPQWLLTKKPAEPLREKSWLRSDDPVFLAWCRHWYDAVCPVIARHQVTRKPAGQRGVILVQLENEYDFAGLPSEVMLQQIKALAQCARTNGIDVPLFTCWTRPVRGQTDPVFRQIFDACNFYPRWNVNDIQKDIEALRREQPDAPLAITELQGGWFSQVGGKLSEHQEGLTAAQINNLTLFAIQNGETILNYYMLFGGTNPGDWAARGMTTSYDYNAPIREWGGVGTRYESVRALGHMLQEHGARLARSRAVPCNAVVSQADVTVAVRRASDGSRYFFVRTSQHAGARQGVARVTERTPGASGMSFTYSLEPFGAKVLFVPPGATSASQGEWLPRAIPPADSFDGVAAVIPITSALRQADVGPTRWKSIGTGQSLALAGIYDSRYVFYRTSLSNPTPTNLLVEFPSGDEVLANANDLATLPTAEIPGAATFSLPSGPSQVLMLYENAGHFNSGSGLEQPSGIFTARLVNSLPKPGTPIPGWRMHLLDAFRAGPEINAEFPDGDWPAVRVENVEADNLPTGRCAVFRSSLALRDSDLDGRKKTLHFGRIDDLGRVYVNGKCIGKTADWSRPYAFDVTRQLRPGRNSIAVIVQNNEGAGGIGAPTLADEPDSSPSALDFGSATGDEEKWWSSNVEERCWKSVQLPEEIALGKADPLLTWYRMKFQLKAQAVHHPTAWKLHLMAVGNGFIYLNDHPLGRYWLAGPQVDFFLPDCWLKCGQGETNLIALSLRRIDRGEGLLTAEVEPYLNVQSQHNDSARR